MEKEPGTNSEFGQSMLESSSSLNLKNQELTAKIDQNVADVRSEMRLKDQELEASIEKLDLKFEARAASLKLDLSDSQRKNLSVLGLAGAAIAIAVFFGAPEYFRRQFDTRWNNIEQGAAMRLTKLDTQSASLEATILQNAATRRKIILASDYLANDPYPVAMLGKIASVAEQLPDPVYVQLPKQNSGAAAAKLIFFAQNFPAGTVLAAVYNPDGKASKLLIIWMKNGQVLIGADNDFTASVVRGLGGSAKAASLDRVPGVNIDPDFPLWGISRIAPAAARIASTPPGSLTQELFGVPYDYAQAPPETESGIGPVPGWVIFVDGFGNCVTSVRMAELQKRFGTQVDNFSVSVGKSSFVVPIYRDLSDLKVGQIYSIDFGGLLRFGKSGASFAQSFAGCKEGAPVSVARSELKSTRRNQ